MVAFMENNLLSDEVKDMIIADIVLTIAFALVFSGGLQNISSGLLRFPYYLGVFAVAMPISFVLHEYMHKIMAQRFGAVAGFRKSNQGILITLFTSMFGFLVGLPGATIIYAHSFTKKQEGYVSLAGPLTNFAVFLILLMLAAFTPLGNFGNTIGIIMFLNIWLAFFNMLPIYPLDGSKVFRWNKAVYVIVMAAVFGLMFYLNPSVAFIYNIVFVLIFAIIISMFYRGFMF